MIRGHYLLFLFTIIALLIFCFGILHGDPLGQEIEKIMDSNPGSSSKEIGALTIPDVPELEYHMARVLGPGRDNFQAALDRSALWRAMIKKKLTAANMPIGLIAVVLQESAFQINAVSPTGAGGLWQFKSATARLLKMRYDAFVDERFDPEISTEKAIEYLKDLYREFGDWTLALAAYNWGRGSVSRCITENNGERDFWKLARAGKIRNETKNYAPSIYARLLIWNKPAGFGFKPIAPTPARKFSLYPFTDLVALEKAAGIKKGALIKLNPQLKTRYTPPAPANYSIWVTEELKGKLMALDGKTGLDKFSTNPEKLIDVKMIWHTVKKGQTLWSISQKYKTCIESLRGFNNWGIIPELAMGMKIKVFVPREK